MFTILDKKKNWYQFLFSGNDLSDWLAYHKALYDIPATERISDSGTHWIQEKAVDSLLQAKTQLKLTPYAYQQEAVDFILEKQSGLMLLPCGAGKTIILIAAYAQALSKHLIKTPGLIVVKASLKVQWREEVKKFSHLNACIIDTKAKMCASELKRLKNARSQEEKERLSQEVEETFQSQFYDQDLFILNYETLKDADVRRALKARSLDFIAADEIQCIKNHTSQRSRCLAEFKQAKIKVGASATPLQKNACDAYGIFSLLVPTLFKSFKAFAANYVKYGGYGKIIGSRNLESLMYKLDPYLFIKTEEDIASQMPQLMAPIQLWCDLDPKILAISNTIFEELEQLRFQERKLFARFTCEKDYLNSTERIQLEGKIMGLQTFAQEIADAPELLSLSTSNMARPYRISGQCSNPRMEILVTQVLSIIDSGEKVIIFSRFRAMQNIIEARLKKEKECKDLKVAKVHGGLSAEQRYQQANEMFKNDPKCKVLLASDALAEGFSAYWCKYLIEYELATSFAVQTQRHGRIRRANSIHQTLHVYQILARNSYDEVALKIISKKEVLDAQLKTKDKKNSPLVE